MIREAKISDCGRFRYFLRRIWDPTKKCLLVVMYNASTGDDEVDDPTIVKTVTFAKREGFGSIIIVNLFAYRTPYPAALKAAGYPVGEMTDDYFFAACTKCAAILVAWGAHAEGLERVERVRRAIKAVSEAAGIPVSCLGRTKTGQPRHPLYLSAATPFEAYTP